MAASRQYVPLREVAGVLNVDDGTMCRMPSPLPGPLRDHVESNLSELRLPSGSGADSPALLDMAVAASTSNSTRTTGSNPPRIDKVA